MTTPNQGVSPVTNVVVQSQSRPTQLQSAFLEALIVVVILSFSPFKSVSYILPWFVVAYLALRGASGTLAMRAFFVILGWATLYGLHYILLGTSLSHTGMILSLITYGNAALLLIPATPLNSEWLRRRTIQLLIAIVLIEAPIGMIQAAYGYLQTGSFDSSNGDYVEGTIDLPLDASNTFANPMFGCLFATVIIGLLPASVKRSRKSRAALIGASIVLVFASVVHVLLFLFAALVAAFVICRPRIGLGVRTIVPLSVGAMILMLSAFAIGGNLLLIGTYANGFLENDYPRTRVTIRALRDLPDTYPWAPYCGVGLGQFCSRAALMSSGLYIGGLRDAREVPILGTQSPGPFDLFVKDLYVRSAQTRYYGSTQQPFYSWLAAFTELGFAPCAILFGYLLWHLNKLRRLASSQTDRLNIFAGVALCLFLFALGAQENYWEIPQATTLGILLYKLFIGSSQSQTKTKIFTATT